MAKINWATKLKQSGVYRRLWGYGELHKAKRIKPITITAPAVAVSGVFRSKLVLMSAYRQLWSYHSLFQAKRLIPGPRAQGQLLWHPYRVYLHNLTR